MDMEKLKKDNQKLKFDHALTHSSRYIEGVGMAKAKKEHDFLAKEMEKKGFKHKSKF